MWSKTIAIALVDDHPLLRLSLEQIIQSQKHFEHVFSGADGEALINYLKKSNTIPDICILDISMKNKNGYETLLDIKTLYPDTKIMIITGYTQAIHVKKMRRLGADAFLSKSSEAEEIVEAIRSVANKGIYYNHYFTKTLVKECERAYLHELKFSELEENVLAHIHLDLSYKEIGLLLHKSNRTIEGVRDSLFKKLEVHTRQALTQMAIQLGYNPQMPSINPLKYITE